MAVNQHATLMRVTAVFASASIWNFSLSNALHFLNASKGSNLSPLGKNIAALIIWSKRLYRFNSTYIKHQKYDFCLLSEFPGSGRRRYRILSKQDLVNYGIKFCLIFFYLPVAMCSSGKLMRHAAQWSIIFDETKYCKLNPLLDYTSPW